MKKMIPCPKCNGGKNPLINFPAFPNKKMLEIGEIELLKMFSCRLCKGKGKVPEETSSWIQDGEILKDRRIKSRYTLREAARFLNVLPSMISNMESGVTKPDMSINYDLISLIET